MALTTGTKLGPYEIESPLGAGGMGEVYRARDVRLDRTVAIKVLPPHLSGNAEAKRRFDREARAISSLNHPNVCTLHDVGHQDGVDFLVMEFLNGPTLGQRLTRGPLAFPEALKYAIEICEGLEKAHRCGVVHRDLKPGNIMLTKSGVKLMDFGLAKAVNPVRTPSGETETVSSPSPDLPLTAEGVVVGTFQYMSPEQVEGKEADARSDIFALGTVFYEMVTGLRAFNGKTTAAVMAAVLEREPEPITASKPACPPAFDRAVRLCLAKDPDERWQTVHDLKLELMRILEVQGAADVPVSVRPANASRLALWGLATASVFALAGLVYLAIRKPAIQPTEKPLTQTSLQFSSPPIVKGLLYAPEGFRFSPYMYALSPDGTKIAFVATSDAKPKGLLFVQSLDSSTAEPLPGIDDVADSGYPFWSPDSKSLGFFSGGKLKRVDASGGVPVKLADAEDAHGGTWSKENFIVFSKAANLVPRLDAQSQTPSGDPNGRRSELLYRISATGGEETRVTSNDPKFWKENHRWPTFLPDGRRISLMCSRVEIDTEAKKISTISRSCIVDPRSQDQALAAFGKQGQYTDSSLLFVNSESALMASPVDASGKTIGTAVPLAAGIARDEVLRDDSFSVSQAGVLAYMTEAQTLSRLVWYDRRGRINGPPEPPGAYDGVSLSRDGMRIATSLANSPDEECLWEKDVIRGSTQRLSEICKGDRFPVWSSDRTEVAYSSSMPPGAIYITIPRVRGDEQNLAAKIAKMGRGDYMFAPELSGAANVPVDFSSDGQLLLYVNLNQKTSLYVHSLDDKPEHNHPLLESEYSQGEANFSPDGRWLAYVSEENRKPEVFVAPFPKLSSKTLISSAGGNQPRWRGDGKELFFVAPDGKMMAVAVDPKGDTFEAEPPQALFQTQITSIAHNFYQYDVTADGQKFIINTRIEQAARPITLLVNWEAELKH